MKKLMALIAALAMILTLTGCFGMGNNASSTADQAKAGDIASYDKDFAGLTEYIKDNNGNSTTQDVYYDILGAGNGVRIILNSNAYVEVYDFSNIVDSASTADSAEPEKAKAVLEDAKDGKFRPLDNGVEMDAVTTDSGKYLIAWDSTRSYDYAGKVATDDLKANW